MSTRFGGIVTARYNGVPVAKPTGLCTPSTQKPKSVTLQIDWLVYWAAAGNPTSLGVEIDLQGTTPEGYQLDKIRTIKIDNTFSTCPMYAFFPDTQDVVSCPPQTVITLPVNSDAQKMFLFAQNLTSGFIPFTMVWLFNILLPPTVDPAIQVSYPQWQGSPVIQQNFNQILTPGFNAPALGDQVQNVAASLNVLSGSYPLFGSPYPSGFITVTGIDLRIFKKFNSARTEGTTTLQISSLGTAGVLFSWGPFYFDIQAGANGNTQPYGVYRSPGNMNLKLDATQLWSFTNLNASVDAFAELSLIYTYSGIPSARNNLPIIPVMASDTLPVPFVASASSNNATAFQAFDALNTTFWISGAIGVQYLQIDCGASKTVYSYSIQADNASGWTPPAFTMSVSNDGVNWNVVDVQTGLTWSNNQIRTFILLGAVSGRYFKWEYTVPGGQLMAFGKVQINS